MEKAIFRKICGIAGRRKAYLISQKDTGKEENLLLKPFYLLPFLIK